MIGNILGGLIGGIGSWLGGKQSSEAAERMNAQNIAMQREFAQHGIRWKVADSIAAGIHPLFGLGAQTHSFSNVTGDVGAAGRGLAEAGQSVGRAVSATATQMERTAAAFQLERMRLENDILKTKLVSDVRRVKQGVGPAFPSAAGVDAGLIPGQGDAVPGKLIESKRQEVPPTAAGMPHQMPGFVPDIMWSRTPSGGYAPVPSPEVKEAIEDNAPYEWTHFIRNMLSSKPPFPAPEGKRWAWDWARLEYKLLDKPKEENQIFGIPGFRVYRER